MNILFDEKYVASDRDADSEFGNAVSINGDWKAVGASAEDGDEDNLNTLNDAGAVYIFKKDSLNKWSETQKIVAPVRAADDEFGYEVRIYGNYMAIGARYEDEDENEANTVANSGSVYIYELNNDTWDFVEKIVSPYRASNASGQFGTAVVFSDEYLVVGALGEETGIDGLGSTSNAGTVYVFNQQNGSWEHFQTLVADTRTINALFGSRLSIDGDRLAVGAIHDQTDENGLNNLAFSGSVEIFDFNTNTNEWEFTQKLVPAVRTGDKRFGSDLSLEGDRILIGARTDPFDESDADFRLRAGSAFIFDYNGATWSQTQKIAPPNRGGEEQFGNRVKLSNEIAYINARVDQNHGVLHVFELDAGNWVSKEEIEPDNTSIGDLFSSGFDIDGNELTIGATGEDEDENENNTFSSAGSVYNYKLQTLAEILNFRFEGATDSTITISTDVNDGYSMTTVSVEIGTESGSYDLIEEVIVLEANNATTSIEYQILNLDKSEKYFIRISATNSVGTSVSSQISAFAVANQDDFDSDGIDNDIENDGPNSGDGNSDGVLDSEQRNVATLILHDNYVTIEIENGCSILENVAEFLENNDLEAIYPYGQVEFQMPCSLAEVKLYFHGAENLTGYTYRKIGRNGRYYEMENAVFGVDTINGNEVAYAEFELIDGGAGDADGETNGIIRDPGGPAIISPENIIPIWDWWWVVAIIISMSITYWLMIRKQV